MANNNDSRQGGFSALNDKWNDKNKKNPEQHPQAQKKESSSNSSHTGSAESLEANQE